MYLSMEGMTHPTVFLLINGRHGHTTGHLLSLEGMAIQRKFDFGMNTSEIQISVQPEIVYLVLRSVGRRERLLNGRYDQPTGNLFCEFKVQISRLA